MSAAWNDSVFEVPGMPTCPRLHPDRCACRCRMSVPMDVDQQKVAAEFKDGVLNVHLPKTNGAKPRSVDILVA